MSDFFYIKDPDAVDDNYSLKKVKFDNDTNLQVNEDGDDIIIMSKFSNIKEIRSATPYISVYPNYHTDGHVVELSFNFDDDLLVEMIEEYRQEKLLREKNPQLDKLYKDYKMYAKLVRQHLDKDEE